MSGQKNGFEHYPTIEEVDDWINSLMDEAEVNSCTVEVLNRNSFSHHLGVHYASNEFRYVKFTPKQGTPFYGYWQPAWSQPAPLLIHVPGYGAEMSTHPDLVQQGYHVLHISPLGYTTPDGPNEALQVDGEWPVLPDTVSNGAKEGYGSWLLNCIQAINWAEELEATVKGRLSFFGTSQGGGGALLLGSIFRDRGVRCVAADVPFLTNFPLAAGRGAYALTAPGFTKLQNPAAGWRSLGFIDTLSHARRLTMPVLLTGGGDDLSTPIDTIETLFERLPGTRSYTMLQNTGHRYTREFMHLASAWFRIYA
ncbi:acetylxylan esterase [Paenibacillus sp. PAMC21692]|uniref:acetylxylan esterase n=1 Tax=Paenibacillus sp. PAMC21692 TaxID=2762320 RepID=UPI00164E943B|nr:acetylxylan esterase [Paenibacillus sp. PAMC21692]QNK59529.1 acetylxylan esterase [Paenibacillus sp. PAMC21692]